MNHIHAYCIGIIFIFNIYSQNSRNYSLRARLRFRNLTVESGLNEKNFFVDSFEVSTVISWTNLKFISSSGLEIFPTLTIHQYIVDLFINVFFLFWLSSLLFEPSAVALFGLSSTSSWQMPSAEKKSKLILKKYIFKNWQPFRIYWWW